jgi:predicted alpha-1,6-mannanase (GH76 family)
MILASSGCSCECYNVVRRLDYGSKVHDWPIQILLKRDELMLEGIKQFFCSSGTGRLEVLVLSAICVTC